MNLAPWTLVAKRYTIIGKIGSGGMGSVYRVTDTVNDLQVALKILHYNAYKSAEGLTLFRQEFRWMNALRHPNLLVVHDYGVLEDLRPYFTMEVIDGVSLDKMQNPSVETACTVVGQMCLALGFLHSRNFVHRDIKPANVKLVLPGSFDELTPGPGGDTAERPEPPRLLGRTYHTVGQDEMPRFGVVQTDPRLSNLTPDQIGVKLMDFGLMQQVGVPVSGEWLGTLEYLAPEVALGRVVDHRADLYALGCMLYQLLTGELPFTGEEPWQVLHGHIEREPTPPIELRPDLPPELNAIILRLLAKNPQDRHASAEALLTDLAPWCPVPVIVSPKGKASYLYSSSLVGRDHEMDWLGGHVEAMVDGQGAALFVGAPAGIGKSRLLAEFSMELQLENITICQGACTDRSRSPYAPVREALTPLLLKALQTPTPELRQAAPILVKVLPALGDVWKDVVAAPPHPDAAHEQELVLLTLCNWLRDLSKSFPLVMVLEDVHWADAATVNFIRGFVQACLPDCRVLMILTYRSDEMDETHPLSEVAALPSAAVDRLRLRPFDHSSLPDLLHQMLGRVVVSGAVKDQLLNASGGNVFFLTELLRYLIDEKRLELVEGEWIFPTNPEDVKLPGTVQTILQHRLDRLPANAVRAVALAAVLNRPFDVQMAVSASDLSEDDTFEALDTLVGNQVLNRLGSQYQFIHHLVQEGIYERIPPEDRTKLHTACGNLLEEHRNHGDATVREAELAYHFYQAGDLFKSYRYGLQAAEEAFTSHAFDDARESYIKLDGLLEKHPEIADASVREGVWERLAAIGFSVDERLAIEYAHRIVVASESWGKLYLVQKLAPHVGSTLACLAGALLSIGTERLKGNHCTLADVMERARKIYTHVCLETSCLAGTGMLVASRERSRRLLAWVTDFRTVPYAAYMVAHSMALQRQGRFSENKSEMEVAARILETDFKTPVTPYDRAIALGAAGYGDVATGLAYRGLSACEEWTRQARKIGDEANIHFVKMQCDTTLLTLFAFRGDIHRARPHIDVLDDAMRRQRLSASLRFLIAMPTAWIRLERGEVDAALRSIDLLTSIDPENLYFRAWACLLRSRMGVGADEALRLLDESLEYSRHPDMQCLQTLVKALCLSADVLMDQGNLKQAGSKLQEAYRISTDPSSVCEFDQIVALRLTGRLACLEGNAAAGRKHLEQSLALAGRIANPIQEAFTRIAIAREAPADASVHLSAARAIFETLENSYQVHRLDELQVTT